MCRKGTQTCMGDFIVLSEGADEELGDRFGSGLPPPGAFARLPYKKEQRQ